VGDVNNDGNLDAAVVGYRFIGSGYEHHVGQWRWLPSARNDAPSQNRPKVIAAADFNGDGKTDLAIGQYLAPGLNVFLGNGDDSFRPLTLYNTTVEGDETSLGSNSERQNQVPEDSPAHDKEAFSVMLRNMNSLGHASRAPYGMCT
jgi:hypothetical protein